MKSMLWSALALASISGTVSGQGLTAVRPIPGYECRSLELTREQVRDPDKYIPVYRGPSVQSGELGAASALVIVKVPIVPVNGLVEILFLDGRPGWISANILRPVATQINPNANCTPSIMSNGRPGFGR